jgi:hypothetical protein
MPDTSLRLTFNPELLIALCKGGVSGCVRECAEGLLPDRQRQGMEQYEFDQFYVITAAHDTPQYS